MDCGNWWKKHLCLLNKQACLRFFGEVEPIGLFVFLCLPQAYKLCLENFRDCTCVHNIILTKVDWICLHKSIPVLPDLKKEKDYESEKHLKTDTM